MSISASHTSPKPRRRWWRRFFVTLGCIVLFLLLAGFVVTRLPAFGGKASGARFERMQQSPNWDGGTFFNRQPQWVDYRGGITDLLTGRSSPHANPTEPVVVVRPDPASFATAPASGLRITWFGHSSTLIEIDGQRVLLDPFWGERASPFAWVGPQRWFEAPISLDDLPPIDWVLISHDHYDHLDMASIKMLAPGSAQFVVPLGIGAHLERWGIAADRIHELDWWQSVDSGELRITATPARHASGRMSPASNHTFWASYAIVSPQYRLWYSGDTGFHEDLVRIGERLGPFDVTLVDAGQYSEQWPDNHFGPEQAVEANRFVRGKEMIPVHWALLNLAPHTWTEPVERVLQYARSTGTSVRVLRPGEPTELTAPPTVTRWWPELPFQSAREAPVHSTRAGDPAERYGD